MSYQTGNYCARPQTGGREAAAGEIPIGETGVDPGVVTAGNRSLRLLQVSCWNRRVKERREIPGF